MGITTLYKSKLTTPADAVGRIASGVTLSMGMAMSEPPALLKALADRAATGQVDDLKIYYFESTSIAGETVLRYELGDRIHPYCMFVTAVERALIKRGEQDGGRKVLTYVPGNFSQSPRLLTEHVGIDTFLTTVSPMDRHGYFTFGTGNDYSSKVSSSNLLGRTTFQRLSASSSFHHLPKTYPNEIRLLQRCRLIGAKFPV
jgi:itaconate CoA-transferase